MSIELKQISEYIWEIPKSGDMQVVGRIYADKELIQHLVDDVNKGKKWNALVQIKNVACLPGIQKASIAMADIHPGYGFAIGAIGAFDTETGVISVAGVGFDCNCLSGDSEVLHEFGYRKKIKDFRSKFHSQRIKSVNPTEAIIDTEINAFMQFKPKSNVFRVKTEAGHEIIATEDHPFLTSDGMIQLKEIKNEKISVFPFEGVEFEEPSDEIIVDEKDIEKLPLQKNKRQTIEELKKRDLLTLRQRSEKVPYLIKLFGYVLGDGTIYFTKNKGIIWCYGKRDDLEDIRKDIIRLGVRSSKIYSRERHHEIDTSYGRVDFDREELSFKTTSSSLAALLYAMGLPLGDKARQDFVLPDWLFKCPKWQKRLFLASFFGAELSSPRTMAGHGYNFKEPILSINKVNDCILSGRKFIKQIQQLLSEFGVDSYLIKERDDYKNKRSQTSVRLRLAVKNTSENLMTFWGTIGYEYNGKRRALGNYAVQYLKLKEAAPPRVAFNFIKFNEFIKEAGKGLSNTGQIWDRIISKEKMDFNDFVYDFEVDNRHHNFIANKFVVSNCGVRTLKTSLTRDDLKGKEEQLANELFKAIPAGLGSEGKIRLSLSQIDEVLVKGARFSVEHGYGWEEDLAFIEEDGCIKGADPSAVSYEAKERGFNQVGTLGSGNHYLEVQYVSEIYDDAAAKAYGLFPGQILVSIHCGSRALGHQIGTDYLKVLEAASRKYNIPTRERELVCAPFKSPEGRRYFAAINCGINAAFANRQTLAHLTRKTFSSALGTDEKAVRTLYDIGHNTAKLERHKVDGEVKDLIVHRKGATRAFGPGRPEVSAAYRQVGQPVLVGGTMGTCSYILRGTEKGMEEVFGTAIHGAGRVSSREQAKRRWRGTELIRQLREQGIIIKGHSLPGVAEEAPGAYKDVTKVVDVVHNSGIATKVAMAKPLISIKG